MNLFGKRLEELRGHRSKADFARFLGIESAVNYGRYEAGRVPDPEILCEIANRTGCTIDWLLGRVEDRNASVSVVREPKIPWGKPLVISEEPSDPDVEIDEIAEMLAQAKLVKGMARKVLLQSIRKMIEELERRET